MVILEIIGCVHRAVLLVEKPQVRFLDIIGDHSLFCSPKNRVFFEWEGMVWIAWISTKMMVDEC